MSDGLRILVIAPWDPWPLDHGGRLRLYHVMCELSRQNALTLAIPTKPRHRARMTPIADVEVMCQQREPALQARSLATRMAGRHFGRDDRIAARRIVSNARHGGRLRGGDVLFDGVQRRRTRGAGLSGRRARRLR